MIKPITIATLFLITVFLSCKMGKSSDKITYVFNGYKKIGDNEYLDVEPADQSGKNELILVKNWHKLEGIRSTKGLGYRGALLKGMEVIAVTDPIAEHGYKDLELIAD